MIAIDSTTLLMFLSSAAFVPIDKTTGKPIDRPKERIDFLISKLQKARTKIIIPTPAYSEALVRAGAARNEYLRIIDDHAVFKVAAFGTRAAIEVADMTRAAIDGGDKKDGSSSVWAKVKYDRQIVAIAKVEGVTTLYSDDADVRKIGDRHGVLVLSLADCPLPPEERQSSLPLDSVTPKVEETTSLIPSNDQEPLHGSEKNKGEEASIAPGRATETISGSSGEVETANGPSELRQSVGDTNGAIQPKGAAGEQGGLDTISHELLSAEEAATISDELDRQDAEEARRIAKQIMVKPSPVGNESGAQ